MSEVLVRMSEVLVRKRPTDANANRAAILTYSNLNKLLERSSADSLGRRGPAKRHVGLRGSPPQPRQSHHRARVRHS